MNRYRKLLVLGLIPIMVSCGGSEEAEESNEEDENAEACTYSYDETSTIFTWTAFKLTEKIGVDGTFDNITVTANESDDMFGVLTGAEFDIPVNSINSQDEVRDGKVKRSFFGNMEATSSLSGVVNSIDANTASITINMNGQNVDYEGEVTVEGETITVKTTIDITDFDAQLAIDSLGVVCSAKHTGEDGVNKLWSDVDIAVKTTLEKECE